MLRQLRSVVIPVFLTLIAAVAVAQQLDPGVVADEVRRLGINPGNAVTIDGFRLKAGLARVILK